MIEAINVQGLSKAYGDRQVLSGVDLEVRTGEIFGILGANGAGKTTLVEIMQGLRSRDRGSVRVLGHDPGVQRRELRRLVGTQLQVSALPERIRVGEALRLFTGLAGDVVDWRDLRDEWGLAGLVRTSFGVLSGGQRQRLFIALALVNRPRVVFLDELTQGLDPTAREHTWDLVRRIRSRGASVVLVTHYLDEAARLCDRIAVLHRGQVRGVGTTAELTETVGGPVHTRFSGSGSAADGLQALPGVASVRHDGSTVTVTGDSASPVRVAADLARRNVIPADLDIRRPSLDDAFRTLTEVEQ